jgi:hypothetical protein
MTVRKAILLTLILPAAILSVALLTALVTENWNSSDVMIFLFIILGLWVIGLVIGVILSVIFKRPAKEPYFYISGQLIMILTIAAFFCIIRFNEWLHEKQFGNIEHNMDAVTFWNDFNRASNDSTALKAFKKLESTFSNPNDFRLESWHSHKEDTVINNFVDSLQIVTFTYKENDNDELLFSKVTLLNDVARLDIVGEKASASAEYFKILKRRSKDDKNIQETLKELEKVLNSSKNSLKK